MAFLLNFVLLGKMVKEGFVIIQNLQAIVTLNSFLVFWRAHTFFTGLFLGVVGTASSVLISVVFSVETKGF